MTTWTRNAASKLADPSYKIPQAAIDAGELWRSRMESRGVRCGSRSINFNELSHADRLAVLEMVPDNPGMFPEVEMALALEAAHEFSELGEFAGRCGCGG